MTKRADQDRKAMVLDELRIAQKMIESIYQLSQIKSELSKATVTAWALRAKVAVEQAEKLVREVDEQYGCAPEKDPLRG